MLYQYMSLAPQGHPHIHTFYDRVNRITDKGEGVCSFRTCVSSIRDSNR